MPNGAILYEGPSMLDGRPIVVICTFRTKNRKTGDLVGTWILCADVDPITAVKTGRDSTICGGCPLMGYMARAMARVLKGNPNRKARRAQRKGRGCYVNVGQAPKMIYEAYRRGSYPVANDLLLRLGIKGRGLRLGSYGDPVAAPPEVWERFLAAGKAYGNGKHVGYTHQFMLPAAAPFRTILMASVQNEAGARAAVAAGWRYFRVKRSTDPNLPGEATCPASDEAGHRRDCDHCNACDGAGAGRPRQVSIVIIGHASKPVLHNVHKVLDAQAMVA
jgi:hypothetical protein